MIRTGDRAELDAGDFGRTWVTVTELLDDGRASVTLDATDGGWLIVPVSSLGNGRRETRREAEARRKERCPVDETVRLESEIPTTDPGGHE